MTANRLVPPTVHRDDSPLIGNNTCDVCRRPARVIEGPVLEFVHPRVLVCAICARNIAAATTS